MIANAVPTPELKLDIERKPSAVLVRGKGNITGATAEILNAAFRGLIPEAGSILLDLTNVKRVDAAGLSTLLSVYISVQRAGCQLHISNLPRTRWRLLSALAPFDFRGLIRDMTRAALPITAVGRRLRARWI